MERTPTFRSCGTYWLDAAQDGIPTSEQLGIEALPFFKLRLGRISGGRQKGVDRLILRDMFVGLTWQCAWPTRGLLHPGGANHERDLA